MALYSFECTQHGEFDIRLPMMGEHKASCPQCGAEARRQFGPVPYRLDNPPDLSDMEKHRQELRRERAQRR